MKALELFCTLTVGVLIPLMAFSAQGSTATTSIAVESDVIVPLDFVPLDLQKPMTNASWQKTFSNLAFKKITKLVLELEPLTLAGWLDTLGVEVVINGQSAANRYETSEYSFDAPTQLAMIVNTTVRKIDDSTDIYILLEPLWSLQEAGVRVTSAELISFNPQPSFGEGQRKVPLVVEWNSYSIGGIPPPFIYFTTAAYLGNASESNQLHLSSFFEILGTDAPWTEVYFENERLYHGDDAQKWINSTVAPPEQNNAPIPLVIEFHPRITDRNREITIHLQVYGEFAYSIDPRKAEQEQLLAEIPKVPIVVANVLILNAILLPLAYFRSQRIKEREGKATTKNSRMDEFWKVD
ncbi:MAG: hypothetical protein ACFFGZ_00380 [Candidatus Thorarchaeota archaeon]